MSPQLNYNPIIIHVNIRMMILPLSNLSNIIHEYHRFLESDKTKLAHKFLTYDFPLAIHLKQERLKDLNPPNPPRNPFKSPIAKFPMVWIKRKGYTCPYISDYINRKFRFGIQIAQTVLEVKSTPTGFQSVHLEAVGDGILKPWYHMRIGEDSLEDYNIRLAPGEGLTREPWASKTFECAPGNFAPKMTLPRGTYDDFIKIGEYAAKRLPSIAQEISLPLEAIARELPEDIIKESKEHWSLHTEVTESEWESWQRDIEKQFRTYFSESVEERRTEDEFTNDQAKTLWNLVSKLGK